AEDGIRGLYVTGVQTCALPISGAGKSRTMCRIVEEAFDYVQTIIVDPEGEFGNLAAHIGATTLKAGQIAADGLTAAALRARRHRSEERRVGKACTARRSRYL